MYSKILFQLTTGFQEADLFQKLTIHVARQPIKQFGQKSYEMWRTMHFFFIYLFFFFFGRNKIQ